MKKKFQWTWLSGRLLGLWLAGGLLLAAVGLLLWPAGAAREELLPAAVFLMLAAVILILWAAVEVDYGLNKPLARLRQAIQDWQGRHILAEQWPEEIIKSRELGTLAGALYAQLDSMEQRLEETCTHAREETERRVYLEIAEEIGRSALPQVLPDLPSRENFAVNGLLSPGGAASCCFYDYFYIDPGLLCITAGQVPGGGVPEALFMVVAQTTIRSRLRQGRSLAETMSDVNAQLYDLGSKQSVSALVGTLNTADGRFQYVNAGAPLPLLMRNEDRCEWLETPVYAPLGMNENVSYRTMELRLKQGDRLMFHTSGLGAAADECGRSFGEQELRAALNLSISRGIELGGVLKFLQGEAAAFCRSEADRLGYAALLLEFQKGDKELAHCEVPGKPEYAKEVMVFLKKQFADNGIAQRFYARSAVIVDEMFALCCRRAVREDTIMVECGVAPDAQMVNIRITAVLGGVSPLEAPAERPAEEAIQFVQNNADFIAFNAGEGERDTLTIVCFLE